MSRLCAYDEPMKLIPDRQTSNVAAAILASKLGKPYITALIKNRYVHRTFILPNQDLRQKPSMAVSKISARNVSPG